MKTQIVRVGSFLLFFVFLCSFVNAETTTLPYKIIKNDRIGNMKASYDLKIDLVNENGKKRLPNEAELAAISNKIKTKEKNTQRVFVLFYLPGMKLDAGAYAQAHHNPNLKVQIMEFMLFGTTYEKYMKK